jgi:hypothetical protein
MKSLVNLISERRHAAALACTLALGVLAGCATQDANVRQDPTYEQAAGSPFLKANSDAIARLLAGLDRRLIGDAPLLVSTIVNVNDMGRAAPLGRTLGENYASLLVSQGLNVKEIKIRGDVFVREGTGELMLSRELKDIARTHSSNLVLVGTYSPAANFTFVSLKLVRTEDGRIVRGHDYALPNDRDISKLLQPPRL